MNYAIIRVRLPAVKNLKLSAVYARCEDNFIYNCQIQAVRYIRGKANRSARKSKTLAKARVRKRKAVA